MVEVHPGRFDAGAVIAVPDLVGALVIKALPPAIRAADAIVTTSTISFAACNAPV